jgi:hypothetical protein
MVRQAEQMVELAPPHVRMMYEHSPSQARAHRQVIARFGRHPHRNEVLGRTSTPEELEYLREEVPVHERKPPEVSHLMRCLQPLNLPRTPSFSAAR